MHATDPELNELANELKALVWTDTLCGDELRLAHEMTFEDVADPAIPGGDSPARRKLVHPMNGFDYWSVRIYLGGEQRTIGIVRTADVANAFRFADMAQEYFWKYRIRGAHPPTSVDLNFHRSRVEKDMRDEANAVALLRRIETYLLNSGGLKTAEQVRQQKAQRRAETRPGLLRDTIKVNHQETREWLGGVVANILDESKSLASCIQQLEEKLLARIDQQDASLGKVLGKLVSDVSAIRLAQAGDFRAPLVEQPYTPPGYTHVGPGWPPPSEPTSTPAPLPPNPTTTC